ncbi:anthranilate synthase component I [Streptomyces sp. enrichment culture]|uniref:anthranilate synthase component I n=1 Tax=Streptomyces sp. enrichment culture TaxID=1795815 RepID=UPI003F57139C
MTMLDPSTHTHWHCGALTVRCRTRAASLGDWDMLVDSLDSRPGGLLESAMSYPGRYTPWRLGFTEPFLVYEALQHDFRFTLLRPDAGPVARFVFDVLVGAPSVADLAWSADGSVFTGTVVRGRPELTEEMRTTRPTSLEPLRLASAGLATDQDHHFGWYSAFGYELLTELDPITPGLQRPDDLRKIVAYLPGRLLTAGAERDRLTERVYTFDSGRSAPSGTDLRGIAAGEAFTALVDSSRCEAGTDDTHQYQEGVRRSLDSFGRGELFEVVLSQTISRPVEARPSTVYRRLVAANPAPYQFFFNLGRGESLVGASPEMYVRVTGDRVETCPISGTAARGADALEDAQRIRDLLGSEKEEAELTMCTDVDRNDKSRVCRPGTVEIIGRRQVEVYSRLIHTVDHVHGILREDCDAWDAFLSHMWAVTVTGAPKHVATQFIEDNERSPRRWYGGAVGVFRFDGTLDSGLTLRAARLSAGEAEVRVGATLLLGSDPEAEERETRLKASAVLGAVTGATPPGAGRAVVAGRAVRGTADAVTSSLAGPALRVLLIDHEDSFVNTLADYFRQTGCAASTRRWGFDRSYLADADAVVLSPGPGRPEEFKISQTVHECVVAGIPVFGVCLGMQGILEYFGGRLSVLPRPVHGRPSELRVRKPDDPLFEGLPGRFPVGRYHSLHVLPEDVPESVEVTALSDDGVVMAVRHRELPVSGVQFHPESLMSLQGGHGLRMIGNAVRTFRAARTIAR